MPTSQFFDKLPPFPNDVSTIDLPCLSFSRLLSRDKGESEKLFEACRTHGFLILDLRDTPDGETLLQEAERMFELNRAIHDLDVAEKMKYTLQPPKSLFGYKRAGSSKVESGTPDRVEFWNISQDDMLGTVAELANPVLINSNRAAIKSYMCHNYAIVTLILSHLEEHLHLPSNTLAALQPLNKASGTSLRMLRYPPQPVDDRRTSLLGHTDIGTVTILFNVLGGLQILPSGLDNAEKNWRYIRPEPGCAIINIGDAMVEWSGGLLRSNMHRVTHAPGKQAECERYSVAYLVRPEYSVLMRKLNGEQEDQEGVFCTAAEWELNKSKAAQSGRNIAGSMGGYDMKALERSARIDLKEAIMT